MYSRVSHTVFELEMQLGMILNRASCPEARHVRLKA